MTHPSSYRFDNFKLTHALADMRFSADALAYGDVLHDQRVVDDQGRETTLRAHAAGRPLVIATGSVSCPLTISTMSTIEALYKAHGGELAFALIYAREAHPGERIPQPQTIEDKIAHARNLQHRMGTTVPVLIDDIDGTVHRALDTKPNSLHIVAPDGKVLYRALFAGSASVERAVARVAAGCAPHDRESAAMMHAMLRMGGYAEETINAAGPKAYHDVLMSTPPVVLLGKTAQRFTSLDKSKRGAAAAALIGVTTTVAIVAALVMPFVL
jgi:hypothetical protein